VACDEEHAALEAFVGQVASLRAAIGKLEKTLVHEDGDAAAHATHIARKVKPAMDELRAVADQLEAAAGKRPSAARQQEAVIGVLKKVLKNHKRVIFDGDGYSDKWHKEAEKRGLPALQDSVAAFPVLKAPKTIALFQKYDVLTRAEVESRWHIAVEKYVKQMTIEAETMVSLARSMILPAALQHQTLMAEAVGATLAAEVACDEEHAALEAFVGQVASLRAAIGKLERTLVHDGGDPAEHAVHIARKVKPAMDGLRAVADQLEATVAAELWPLPTYRELLFLK
jgi:glutamine synthetase